MTTFNFDMHRIGRTIAELRKQHNMTQMQLADEMGVSFQAVSNWERGQSMPDISKLPELAEILHTTIDELLGRSIPLIAPAIENTLAEYVQHTPVTVEEVSAVAPILKPEQVEQLADTLPDDVRFQDVNALLPS